MDRTRRRVAWGPVGGLLAAAAILAWLWPGAPGATAVQPRTPPRGPEGEAVTMQRGAWEGEYIDVDGHHAQVRFDVTATGEQIEGRFELRLATEDEGERYDGRLSGHAAGDRLVLTLHLQKTEPMVCTVALRRPLAYAQQAVYGVVEPVPGLNFGGGTLIAWHFRRE